MLKESSKKRKKSSSCHLTDEEIALCAQELALGSLPKSIPIHVKSHLDGCYTCSTNVHDLCRLIYDEPVLVEAIRKEKGLSTLAEKQCSPEKIGIVMPHNSKHRWLYAAAAVLVLIAISIFALFQPASTPEQLFANYYSPYQDIITSKSTVYNQELVHGLFYYNAGNYEQAIIHFNNGLIYNPKDHDILFYLAGSYLAIGDYKEAIPIFELLHTISPQYHSPVRWYLALSYLAGNKTGKAVKMLESIRDEGGFYAEDAEKILRKLK